MPSGEPPGEPPAVYSAPIRKGAKFSETLMSPDASSGRMHCAQNRKLGASGPMTVHITLGQEKQVEGARGLSCRM